MKKKCLVILLYLCFLCICLELFSLLGLWTLKRVKNLEYSPVELTAAHRDTLNDLLQQRHGLILHDPDLGWTARPNAVQDLFTINSRGVRSTREYSAVPGEGIVRISAFGDSFVQGAEVADRDCWAAKLERLEPNLEVLNFGMVGYGLDQAYLRYRKEGAGAGSQLVLIGFMSDNIFRCVNVFRPYYHPLVGIPLAKPRFELRGDGLALRENPMPSLQSLERLLENEGAVLAELGEHDDLYRGSYSRGRFDVLPSVRLYKVIRKSMRHRLSGKDRVIVDGRYNTGSDAFRITTRTFDRFYRQVIEDGAVPVIVLFPASPDIIQWREDGTVCYQPLVSWLRAGGYRHVDLLGGFEEYGRMRKVGELFEPGSHYSAEGNDIVARSLDDYLERQGLTTRAAVERVLSRPGYPEPPDPGADPPRR